MSSRRKFIQSSLLTGAAIPFASYANASKTRQSSINKISDKLPKEEYWNQVRNLFPIPKNEAYFNTGTLGVSPFPVLEAMTETLRFNAANATRTDYKGEGPLLLTGYEPFEEVRKQVGDLINADFKEISLTQNATFGMNFLAHGLELRSGDEIIQTDQEHGGGSSAWKLMAKRYGLNYKEAKMPVPANDPQEIIDSIMNEVTNKTKVIAIPSLVSVYGVVMPVKEICRQAKERGILTVLDGAQAVGQVQVDVKDIGCNAYFSSLHKWLLAPGGSGILYVDSELQPKLWATLASYNWENENDHGFRLQQYGTGNPALVSGLSAAIDFHNSIGSKKWTGRVKELGDYLRNGLQTIDRLKIHSSVHNEMSAGITTYEIPGVSGPDIQKEMWKRKKLQPRSVGKELVRHSTHIYNSKKEIDDSLKILRKLANGESR